ncbi:hypothetical protein IGI04_014764, partial [Brassica rapa subsp. trilocularis]
AIPSLRNHFREDVYGASSGCPRISKMQYKRKSGTKEFSLKAVNDKLGQIEGPTNPIGGPSNNAQSGQAHADSVEATGATPGAEALKAMEGRLMNAVRDAVRDAMKGVKEKVTSLFTQLGLLEEEVKSLRWSVPGSDNPAVQDDGDGSDNSESEEEDGDVGGDKESEEEDGGDNNEPDEEDEMYAHAVEAEKKLKTKAAESVNTKKKRSRKDDGKEAVPVKKVKVDRGDNVRSPIQVRSRAAEKRTRGAKKQKAAAEKKAAAAAKKKAAAEKEAAAENEAAAEKEAAKKKAAAKKKTPAKKKQKKPKTKKVRKKTEIFMLKTDRERGRIGKL